MGFTEYFRTYTESYAKKDRRVMLSAYRRFAEFMRDRAPYSGPDGLNRELVAGYADFLRERYAGESVRSLYAQFRKVVLSAVDHDILPKAPCRGVAVRTDRTTLRKDILSPDEIRKLAATRYEGERPQYGGRSFSACIRALGSVT